MHQPEKLGLNALPYLYEIKQVFVVKMLGTTMKQLK